MHLFQKTAVLCLLAMSTVSAQDWAKSRLEKSPRHLEYVKLKQGSREVNSLVVYPEVKDKAAAVIVIHEIFGLSDWVKSVADQFAEAGYIAIAPDLLSGMGPKGGGTDELGGGDGVRRVIRDLPPDQITADLNAAYDYVAKLPACNGRVAVAGFCWGGRESFRFATNNQKLKAAMVFYGAGPENAADVARIACPVHGFYGENDARINMTIAQSTELMKGAGKTFEPVIYKGAGHGFVRAGEQPDPLPANQAGRDEAWKRIKLIMKSL